MRHKAFQVVLLLGALIGIAVGVFLFFLAKPVAPRTPLPNPNGYDTLMQAAGSLPASSLDYRKLNHEDLISFTAANSNALQLVRLALQQESIVPVQFSDSYISSHTEDLARIKQLSQAMLASGWLDEMESRPAKAALAYLDTIQMGLRSGRGGVLIDHLVGIAVEAMGTSSLKLLVPQLDQITCRDTAKALEKLDAERLSWDDIMDQEREWAMRSFPGIRNRFAAWMQRKSLGVIKTKLLSRYQIHQGDLRRLIIQLAARAYELEKGAAPKNLSDLVPDYLKAIPQDPVTGTNLAYLP